MAFQPRNITTHNPHELVVLPPAPPSLIVPDNHEDMLWPDVPARLLDDESLPNYDPLLDGHVEAWAAETRPQRAKREREARKARITRWVEQAHVRVVPGAVTDNDILYKAFDRTTPCASLDETAEKSEFLVALRAVLGRSLAVRWQGKPNYMAVIADNVPSYQTGDDIDLLPGFDPAPPTKAERAIWNWPHVRLREAVEQEIAAGRRLAIAARLHWLVVHDGNAWRPVDDTRLRAAFARCFALFGIEKMGQSAYQMALDAVMKDLAVPFLVLARNAAVTVERSGRLRAYPVQPGTGSLQGRRIDWSEVDDATGEYRPVAQRGEPHVLDTMLAELSYHDFEVVEDMIMGQAHVRHEARALRQAATEAAAPSAPARRRL
ncbi:hypothetical protein [Burkholderia pseudomallei]|uniref:hypothetical protein n=1 Tax=Burkholderia pseudomallei TaxID=28450 RepID=UPI0019EB8022|nr:hypothetical protein [Burkholderia pseudomallei]MBF3831150.1 hypothetical protein [Burkholderia pseudomallei]